MAREKLEAKGIEAILEAILNGQSFASISREVGVGVATLHEWLHSPEYSARTRDALAKSAQACDEMAEAELRAAQDPFELAKARELAHHWRWRAKVRNPKQYGDKTQTEVTGADGSPLSVAVQVSFVAPKVSDTEPKA